jgi:hypothetical protein
MCSAIISELESIQPDIAVSLWAPSSSHMRTLVELISGALQQTPGFRAGYVVVQRRRCRQGSDGCRLTCDAILAGTESSADIASIVSSSREWKLMLASTRIATAASALQRRVEMLSHFANEESQELIETLSSGALSTGRASSSASNALDSTPVRIVLQHGAAFSGSISSAADVNFTAVSHQSSESYAD